MAISTLNLIQYVDWYSSFLSGNSKTSIADSMYPVTSSLFLGPVFSLLKRISQQLLLLVRGYFATSLTWYHDTFGRGRPEIDIARFFWKSLYVAPYFAKS